MLVCMLVTVLVWGGMVVTDEPLTDEPTEAPDAHINDAQ
jgi:hypothetical protein